MRSCHEAVPPVPGRDVRPGQEVHHPGPGRHPRLHPGGGGADPAGAGRGADGPELLRRLWTEIRDGKGTPGVYKVTYLKPRSSSLDPPITTVPWTNKDTIGYPTGSRKEGGVCDRSIV